MKLERVEIVHVAIPLVSPFRTSFGTMTTKDTFLLHVVTDTAEGWSEFAADPEPGYCSEFVAGAEIVLRDFLLPRVAALPVLAAAHLGPATDGVKGHELAKAALETAVLDAELRSYGMSLATYLGRCGSGCRPGCRSGSSRRSPSCWTPWRAISPRDMCGSS